MERATLWKNLFQNWPKSLPRKGVLLTVDGEQTPFHEFMTNDGFILLQRRAPDTMGAREVLIPFSEIGALKMVDVVQPSAYREAGFKGA